MRVTVDAGALARFLGENTRAPAPGHLGQLIIPTLDITRFIRETEEQLPSLPALPGEPVYSEEATPAAGLDYIRDLPNDEAWRLHHLSARLVTSAVVADRLAIAAVYKDATPTKYVMVSPISTAIQANMTALISFNIGQPPGFVGGVGIWSGFLPGGLTILPGARLALWIYNLQAADQIDRVIIGYERFRS